MWWLVCLNPNCLQSFPIRTACCSPSCGDLCWIKMKGKNEITLEVSFTNTLSGSVWVCWRCLSERLHRLQFWRRVFRGISHPEDVLKDLEEESGVFGRAVFFSNSLLLGSVAPDHPTSSYAESVPELQCCSDEGMKSTTQMFNDQSASLLLCVFVWATRSVKEPLGAKSVQAARSVHGLWQFHCLAS